MPYHQGSGRHGLVDAVVAVAHTYIYTGAVADPISTPRPPHVWFLFGHCLLITITRGLECIEKN